MNTALGLLLVNAKNRPQRDGVSYIKNDVVDPAEARKPV